VLSAALLIALAPLAASGPSTELFPQAIAATPDSEHGRILYLKHCAACHRSRAWGDGPREIPALAGQRQRYLIEQLALFASDERKGSVMHGSAMHETLQRPNLNRPQAISDLAAYLSRASRNPEAEHSEGRSLAVGRRTYARACFAAGHRLHPPFPGFAVGLSAEEQEVVADYVSRLTALSPANSR
jgi:cytochrome c553